MPTNLQDYVETTFNHFPITEKQQMYKRFRLRLPTVCSNLLKSKMYFFIPLYNKFPDSRDDFCTKEKLFRLSSLRVFPERKVRLEVRSLSVSLMEKAGEGFSTGNFCINALDM